MMMFELQRIFNEAEHRYDKDPMEFLSARRSSCIDYAWSIPTPEVIERLAAFSPIVEVAAGTGYWASLLAEAGASIEAFDLNPPGTRRYFDATEESPFEVWHSHAEGFFPVIECDATEVAASAGDRTLMISWPEYQEDWCEHALRAFVEAGGQRVIYIGEGSDGCCGTPEFFTLLGAQGCRGCFDEECGYVEDEWLRAHTCQVLPEFRQVEYLPIPQWFGMHDGVYVYERL
jgi:hypothetical protein